MTAKLTLVTGGTGFTGGHLCRRLSKDGHTVRALVRDSSRAAHLIEWGVEVVTGDLRDPASLEQAMEGVDLVYHIAANFRLENVSRQDMWDINTGGTKNMLDAAVKAGVQRFVHCSTIGVHGDVKNPPATEESPYNPGDYYQESKLEGELIAQQYMTEGRLPITIFRPAGIYGPRESRFLKLMKAVKKGRFAMIGSGETYLHLIFIDDLIDGILLCGTAEQAVGNIYILAGDEPITLNQLVQTIANVVGVNPPRLHIPFTPVYLAGYACELICKSLGINPPLYRRRVDFFRKNRWFDNSKAKQYLGFDPQVDLETGIRRTIAWYENEGLL